MNTEYCKAATEKMIFTTPTAGAWTKANMFVLFSATSAKPSTGYGLQSLITMVSPGIFRPIFKVICPKDFKGLFCQVEHQNGSILMLESCQDPFLDHLLFIFIHKTTSSMKFTQTTNYLPMTQAST